MSDDGRPVVTNHTCVTVHRPVDAVAAYVFDPRTMPHWSAVLFEAEDGEDRGTEPGVRLRANLKILGVNLTVQGELVDIDIAARRALVRITPETGGGQIEHRLSVDDLGDGAAIHFWNRVAVPAWLAEAVSLDLVRRFLERTTSFALLMIKDILEGEHERDVAKAGEFAAGRLPPRQHLSARRDEHGPRAGLGPA